MDLRFVWADGKLGFANAFSKKPHRDILKSMVESGQIQPPVQQYIGGQYHQDNFHGPAFDSIHRIWESGDQLPTDDELRYMIQSELGLSGREAMYERMADVEDTEPEGGNVGFLRDPHKDLYPNLFQGKEEIPEEVKKTLKDHVLEPLSKEFTDPDKFIYFTIYGSGISYNWDESGDLDLQLWVDIEKYSATVDDPMTIDDLIASVRRIVQTVNFPSFASLGLMAPENSPEDTTGAMTIQYYPKPGKGTRDENLASKPYACYDLETDEWLVKPEPMEPKFYGDAFLLLQPKAKDIALQAEALIGELQRNILNWQFWFAMYQKYQKKEYREQYREAMENATQEHEGIHNLFLGVFGGRAQAYSPEGEGIYDERDILQKLLEVYGVFQQLRHFTKLPLPWDEQELPAVSVTTSRWKIASVSNDILFAGGATLDPVSLTPVRHDNGYYVSVAGQEHIVPADQLDDDAINNYLSHAVLGPHEYLGAWVSGPQVYLDVTKWIPSLEEAMRFGVENGQQAIWDIENQNDIMLPRTAALRGLPSKAIGPHPELQQVAQQYMQEAGLPYNPPQTYQRVDPQRAQRIAEEYERAQHNPTDPRVRASYGAMINETMAQYKALRRAGYQFEFYPPDRDPYPSGPRAAIEDLRNNKHMYVYPTSVGYGQGDQDLADHPLLGDSGERWNGHPVLHNDIFRAVHDAFGHGKEGVGFRADGEENAWRQHSSMYSPVARPAMTAETRGQNSWVNFGPHGESNQTANHENTIYADQKATIMPDWAVYDGAHDARISALRKIALWSDIMEKAQRLRDNGQVQIQLNDNNHVVGIVQGDHGTYNTEIWRDDPNSGTITLWNCDCPWSQYSWGRTRIWKKYEGRPCAHTLALYWTSLNTPTSDENQQTIPGTTPQQQPQVNLPNAIQQTVPGQQTPQAQPMQQPDLNAPPPDTVTPQQAEQLTIAFPGALAKWRKEGQFINGDYVRANVPVDGLDDRGTYYVVPRNMIGEVLWSDDDDTIAIFSIESGPLGPHNVKVTAPTESFSLVPRTRGTAPRRRQ